MLRKILIICVLVQHSAIASTLSEGAFRLIKIDHEIGSRDVALRGQSLLLKGAFYAMYKVSKQVRKGSKFVRKSYDPALYEYALNLLDGNEKSALMAAIIR